MHSWSRAVAVLAMVVGLVARAGWASAGPAGGPELTIDRSEVSAGEPLLVSLAGFQSHSVTISVCGNLAKRGSADCAMGSSQGTQIEPHRATTLAELVVQPPPMPCPCLVRAVSRNGDEFAVAPLVVTGHPVGPVVGVSSQPFVELTVSASRATGGIGAAFRSALGGRTEYNVSVSVRNLATDTLQSIRLDGAASNRWSDELVKVPLGVPGPLEPGQTWTKTLRVSLPAPVLGAVHWNVTASGAGPTVSATRPVTALPWLLYLLTVIFVLDVGLLIWHWRPGRRNEQRVEDMDQDELAAADLEAMWDAPAAARTNPTPPLVDRMG